MVWNINFIFSYIGDNHPNWLIFFRGVQTTSQFNDSFWMSLSHPWIPDCFMFSRMYWDPSSTHINIGRRKGSQTNCFFPWFSSSPRGPWRLSVQQKQTKKKNTSDTQLIKITIYTSLIQNWLSVGQPTACRFTAPGSLLSNLPGPWNLRDVTSKP